MPKTKAFIEKARAKHGDRYSYDRVVYVHSLEKVIITCTKHGDFEQVPSGHLRGVGCAKCGKESMAIKRSEESKNSFIERSRVVHGDKYDYLKTVYFRSYDKVIITCKQHGDFEQSPKDHLNGKGCAKCGTESMAIKLSQEAKDSFIEKARAKHGDLYDYDRVVYVRAHGKVIITCAKHGDFDQTPDGHLSGNGCAQCGFESGSAKKTQESKDNFIERSRARHGDLYDYRRTVYVGALDKVIITCAKHGDFEQTPRDHLRGRGCAKCGNEAIAIKLSQEAKDSFIEKAREVHGDRYDYSKAVYIHSQGKVIITCKIHGDFEQAPSKHLSGRGCAKCSGKYNYSTLEWVQEAIDAHGDRYDYGRVVYVRNNDKVIITCKQHGDFEQTPSSHLSGKGCPSCPARYDQPTNLYLMHDGLGKVKVGYTIDLNRRITELNSTAPFKAELLETWTLTDTPTVRKIESKVHRKLAKYHAGLSGFDGATEWFNASPDTARKHIIKALSGAEVLGHSEANSSQLSLI